MAMTQQEAVDALSKTNETLTKVASETDALLKKIDELNAALASAAGSVTPELEAAIAAVDAQAHAIDDLVADVPPAA